MLSGLLKVYRRLPGPARDLALGLITPAYRVGSTCVLEREDGGLLLVRTSYRRHPGWGFPGGHLNRNEEPSDCVVREIREELGVEVTAGSEPLVVVSPRTRRVDLVFRCELSPADRGRAIRSQSPEIEDVGWFRPDALPVLLPEAAKTMRVLAGAGKPPARA